VTTPFEDNRDNVFLQGNRAPVREEQTCLDLRVVGTLPDALTGMFLRNGPNPQFDPRGRYHWWDGDGMIHAVQLEQGRATYRNRWVRTKAFQTEQAAGHAIWRGMMYPPDLQNPLGSGRNPSNTNIMFVGGRVLSLWEGGRPYRLLLPDLETQGSESFGGKLGRSMTAHPHRDLRTGETLFFGYSATPPWCTYGIVGEDGELSHVTPIELPAPSMMHDFVFTERFAIVCDFPCKIRVERAMRGGNPITWEPEMGSRFGVLPRRGTNADVRWFVGRPGYVFHFANAYEEGERIIIHGSRMEHTSFAAGRGAGAAIDMGSAEKTDDGSMYRFVLDLASGSVHEEPLDDRSVDFVRIHPGRFGLPHRYTFGSYCQDASEPGTFDHYIKYDHLKGTSEVRALGARVRCGEAVFVPRPGATDEDDGWVVGLTHDEDERRSELVILNGQDFTGEAQARVQLPTRVPYGFHAEWITAEEIARQRP
jgi:carotenoid cleavage dioxygenase